MMANSYEMLVILNNKLVLVTVSNIVDTVNFMHKLMQLKVRNVGKG
jgi:hypothetical protein